ncbi:12315_t:CDS:2, partial [Cetraspora pellucida]
SDKLKAPLKFIYSCFLKPIGNNADQKSRLDSFYEDQAEVYDATRGRLLRGRLTMLKLTAGHLKKQMTNTSRKPIWIDIGGGTGWNVEKMNDFFPIEQFDKVFLVDLCAPLCKIAETRFHARGWSNVYVICEDAASFKLPEIENDIGKIDLITMSYSLSMIDKFYPVIDRIKKLLCPDGLFGIADFYVSSRVINNDVHVQQGILSRHCNWFTRWFWQIWFEFDHINLHPCRRDYVEYQFDTIKSFNGRNHFLIPYFVQIPYYVWLGTTKSSNSASHVNLNPIETISSISLTSSEKSSKISAESISNKSLVNSPVWRQSYNPTLPRHTQFNTYIYAFTWEDPREDLKVLNLSEDDSMLVITSAGDNLLEYALRANPKRIHCVDLNPCQNHLLELKLASISALDYKDFWSLFGKGKHKQFEHLLDTQLSPYLSSHAYQFWKNHTKTFQKNFFRTGSSGIALRLLHLIISLKGLSRDVTSLCHARSIKEQKKVFDDKLRPAILHSWLIKMLNNPVFLWKALGVPIRQWKMLLDEGTAYQYICDTIDGVIANYKLADDGYFYFLCLMLHYSFESCPSYLTQSGFNKLKSGALDSIRIHTSYIIDALKGLDEGELTRAVLMDHIDWFSECEADEEIKQLARAVRKGGQVFWRSSARHPWYNKVFVKHGFDVEPVCIREPGSSVPLDRVNMYASFYRGVKL